MKQVRPDSDRLLHRASTRGTPIGYATAVGVAGICTGIDFLIHERLDHANLIMVYLAGVAVVASRFGRAEAALCSILSILSFDFLFVPPRWTLAVSDSEYLLTFVIMLGVGVLISSLTHRVRMHAQASSERERRTAALYRLSQQMSRSRSKREIATAAASEIRDVFHVDTAVLLADPELETIAASNSGFERDAGEAAAGVWAFKNNEFAGKGTSTLPNSRGLYLPLRGSRGALGVLAILPSEKTWPMSPEQRNLLETFANGLGLAIERTMLAKESQDAKLVAETERLRNALLSSISHDLRTPLTVIAGAASSLKERRGNAEELADTVYEESVRLNIQVQNLLDMTRIQSGEVKLRLEWNSIEEIVANSLARTQDLLEDRVVVANLTPGLPLVYVDGELVEKVILNLLENVSAHTPPDSPVEITCDEMREYVRLNVADRGPGVPKGEEARIFERFFRPQEAAPAAGFGLGLAICRAIMKLHSGRIWVENRTDGQGAVFHVEIPKPGVQPEVPSG